MAWWLWSPQTSWIGKYVRSHDADVASRMEAFSSGSGFERALLGDTDVQVDTGRIIEADALLAGRGASALNLALLTRAGLERLARLRSTTGPPDSAKKDYELAQARIFAGIVYRRAAEGAAQDPDNAFWPAAVAVSKWTLGDREGFLQWLERAAACPRFQDFTMAETERRTSDALETAGFDCALTRLDAFLTTRISSPQLTASIVRLSMNGRSLDSTVRERLAWARYGATIVRSPIPDDPFQGQRILRSAFVEKVDRTDRKKTTYVSSLRLEAAARAKGLAPGTAFSDAARYARADLRPPLSDEGRKAIWILDSSRIGLPYGVWLWTIALATALATVAVARFDTTLDFRKGAALWRAVPGLFLAVAPWLDVWALPFVGAVAVLSALVPLAGKARIVSWAVGLLLSGGAVGAAVSSGLVPALGCLLALAGLSTSAMLARSPGSTTRPTLGHAFLTVVLYGVCAGAALTTFGLDCYRPDHVVPWTCTVLAVAAGAAALKPASSTSAYPSATVVCVLGVIGLFVSTVPWIEADQDATNLLRAVQDDIRRVDPDHARVDPLYEKIR